MTSETGTSGNKWTEKWRFIYQAGERICLFPFACSPIGREQGTSRVEAKDFYHPAVPIPGLGTSGNKWEQAEQVNGDCPTPMAKKPSLMHLLDTGASGWGLPRLIRRP
jgi:hypothetical protein